MTKEQLEEGKALDKQLALIDEVQEEMLTDGAKAAPSLLNALGDDTLVTPTTIKLALGETRYNSLVTTLFTDLENALSAAKLAAQNSFDALGE